MARLYLIRRNLESFVGPMDVDAMRRSYKKMEFGLQDEVSGHGGPWITFDDVNAIRKQYPEIAKLVSEDMLAGWGVGENTIKSSMTGTARIRAARSNRGLGLALVFLVVAAIAFAAAIYISNGYRFSGKLQAVDGNAPNLGEAKLYVEAEDWPGLNSYMFTNFSKILEKVGTNKKQFNDWLPYFRVQAFSENGDLEGIGYKFIRGNVQASAPANCSQKVWDRNFRGSTKRWKHLLAARKLPRKHWARVLLWDPHWVARRHTDGWLWPRNYFAGCMIMAKKVLGEMAAVESQPDAKPEYNVSEYQSFVRRLDWMVSVVSDQPRPEPQPGEKTVLDDITCLESAANMADMEKCVPAAFPSEDWQVYFEKRYNWNFVRLLAESSGKLDASSMTDVNNLYNQFAVTDTFTRFDYTPEREFLRQLIQNQGDIDKAREKAEAGNPSLKLAH